ncbi:MAG: ABC transporter ATP-binding protein [Clostridium sp.]|uniref:ABC transporter ATP-binding protein n=1 Tax=Clostridium sp. TaxID=1506 RepID=UPI003F3544B8
MLTIKELSKTFNPNTVNENRIFDEISLNVAKGDFVSIIGSNGAGKSTLLNIISGQIQEDSGIIQIENDQISHLSEYRRSKIIGRVFQNPSLGISPNMTILENLSLANNKGNFFGLSFAINNKKVSYFKEMLSTLELGLENKLCSKVKLLSGGQRQALTLLMATMSNPKLLLLDEHTAALDPKTSKKIIELTNKIIVDKKITTLMVTHNMKHALNYGNRLFMMHQGKVILDIAGAEKQNLTTKKLLNLFEDIAIDDELSDRSLFI